MGLIRIDWYRRLDRAVLDRAVWFAAILICAVVAAEPAAGQSAGSLGRGLSGWPHAIIEHEGELVIAGRFARVGGARHGGVARWDGRAWQPLGSGMNEWVFALAEYRGDLIAAGRFTTADGTTANRIARWDGSHWQPMGNGFGGRGGRTIVRALIVYEGELIAGGWFSTADGSPAHNIARWDGTSWRPFGEGANRTVRTFLIHEGNLIAGGDFQTIDGVRAARIASWDGRQWRPIGGGVNGHLNVLAEYRGDIVAGGMFSRAGNRSADRVARWDGSHWHPMGRGMTGVSERNSRGNVFDLAVLNDTLFAGGYFRTVADPEVAFLAVWDGREWRGVGRGVNNAVNTLGSYNDKLITGGRFREADARSARFVAQWNITDLLPIYADSDDKRTSDRLVAAVRNDRRSADDASAHETTRFPAGVDARRTGRNLAAADVDHRFDEHDESSDSSDEHGEDGSADDQPDLPPRYLAIPVIGPEPYHHTWLTGLNDAGEAVGFAARDAPFTGPARAIFWSGLTRAVELAEYPRGWIDMTATSLNTDGLAVGWAQTRNLQIQAFLWDQTNAVIALPEFAEALDVDSHGRVLGITQEGQAAVWMNGTMRELPDLPGDHRFQPMAMNDDGWVIGSGWSIATGRTSAFVLTAGTYIDLGAVASDKGDHFAAVAVNNTGAILGKVTEHIDGEAIQRTIIWQRDDDEVFTMAHAIDPLPGDTHVIGIDINDAGYVVGSSGSPGRPFLWMNGQTYDLRDLVINEAKFSLATSINNDVWIAVDGGDACCGYVLQPIDPRAIELLSDDVPMAKRILLLLDSWGPCPAGQVCPADLDGTGNVGIDDLLILLSNGG